MPDSLPTLDPVCKSIADQFIAVRKNLASTQQCRDLAAIGEALVAKVADLEARIRELETKMSRCV
jgi:hypothetical protein